MPSRSSIRATPSIFGISPIGRTGTSANSRKPASRSRAYSPGPYANAEGLLAAFDRHYLAAMDGSAGATIVHTRVIGGRLPLLLHLPPQPHPRRFKDRVAQNRAGARRRPRIVGCRYRRESFSYYFGAAGGGVFKDDRRRLDVARRVVADAVGAIGAIAIAPSNRSIVWAGTGEANPRNDASYGDGIWRSTRRRRALDSPRARTTPTRSRAC